MKTPLSFSLLWASTLCWGACASLLNNEQTRIKVITPPRTTLVVGCDTFLSRTSTHRLHVSRSKTPLHITASRDSVARSYAIPSHNSLAWWLNLYPAPHLWAGFWIDRNKPKRYAYPVSVGSAFTQLASFKSRIWPLFCPKRLGSTGSRSD